MRRAICLLILAAAYSIRLPAQRIPDAAIAAFKASYASEASKDYEKAIRDIGPVYRDDFYEVNLRLGWLHYKNGDHDQSLRYYRQALKLRPSSIEAMFGFVNPAAAKSMWADVFATYQKIISIDRANSVANYRLALMYFYRKEFASADKHLQLVIDHYPFDYDSLLLMAQVKLGEGKISESKEYYSRALLYSPSNDAVRAMVEKL